MKISTNKKEITSIDVSYPICKYECFAIENQGKKTTEKIDDRIFVEYNYIKDCRRCKLLRLFLFYCSEKGKRIKAKVTIENNFKIIGKANIEVIEVTHNRLRVRLTFNGKYKIKMIMGRYNEKKKSMQLKFQQDILM